MAIVPTHQETRENIMSKFSTIKRATVGNLIKADPAGDSRWIVGRITGSDTKKGNISYLPADGSEEIIIKRDYAFKATLEEYNEQLPTNVRPDAVAKPVTADEWDKIVNPPKRETEEVLLADIVEDEEEEDDGKEKPLSRVKDYVENYDVVIAASGKKSRDTGDAVAKELRGLTLAETYQRVAKIIDTAADELMIKYAHLNEGQQRMCLGNRLRGHYRRAARAADDAAAAAAAASAD